MSRRASAQVGGNYLIDQFCGHFGGVLCVGDGRVVDQDRNGAERGLNGAHGFRQRIGPGDIQRQGQARSAAPGDLLRQGVQTIPPSAGCRHRSTLSRQHLSETPAQSRGCAGYQRDLTVEIGREVGKRKA
jgi:hypothetical protein